MLLVEDRAVLARPDRELLDGERARLTQQLLGGTREVGRRHRIVGRAETSPNDLSRLEREFSGFDGRTHRIQGRCDRHEFTDPHHGLRLARRGTGDLLHQVLGSASAESLSEPLIAEVAPRAIGDLGRHDGGLSIDASALNCQAALHVQQHLVGVGANHSDGQW